MRRQKTGSTSLPCPLNVSQVAGREDRSILVLTFLLDGEGVPKGTGTAGDHGLPDLVDGV